MQVIAHHRIGQDIDAEDRGKRFHPPPNPFASEGEILAGFVIDASEKRPTHTPLYGMHDPDFRRNELLRTTWPSHIHPP